MKKNNIKKTLKIISIITICVILATIIIATFSIIKNLIKLKNQFEQEAFIYRIQLESMLSDEEINELVEAETQE